MQRGIVYFLLFVIAIGVGILLWWPDAEPVDPLAWPAEGDGSQRADEGDLADPDLHPGASSPRARGVPRPAPRPHADGGQAPLPADGEPSVSGVVPTLDANGEPVVTALPTSTPAVRSRPATLSVHVEVVDKERFVPPPPVRAEAVLVASGKPLPTTLIAGVGAGFDAPAEAAGSALAAIELGGNSLLRQIVITAGQVARPTLGAPLVVTGSVRDAAGRPVLGATVWFGELLADGSRREVATGEDGAFSAEVLASSGVPFVVRKAGFAALWRPIQVAMPMGPCDAVLQPSCTLDVQVVGAATSMQDARVFVLPQAPVASELTTWPFFAQALSDGYPLDERGFASIGELPRTGTLGVVVRHPLARLRRGIPTVLKGERVRETVPVQFEKESWSGRIVGLDALPLGGVALWSRSPATSLAPGSSQRLLPPHLEAVDTYASRSRADGTFVVAASGGGRVLSIRATGYAGRDVRAADLKRGGDVVLPRWLGGEAQFTLTPPAPGVAWQASTNLSNNLQAGRAADEAWRVSLPHAGRFDFVLTTRRGDEVVASRTYSDVMVTGPIEVAAPSSQR